jgi:hypothetical protein
MNIHTLRDNLKRTIAGKELLLGDYTHMRDTLPKSTDAYEKLYAGWHATVAMLELNIGELRRILADVEVCCEQAVALSWRDEDRQGGV